jgi:hypothetical protein
MSTSSKQIKTDATMKSILEANVVQVFQRNEESVPGEAENILSSEAEVGDGRLHVDDQGFLTSGRSVGTRSQTSGSNNESRYLHRLADSGNHGERNGCF